MRVKFHKKCVTCGVKIRGALSERYHVSQGHQVVEDDEYE